jgi:anti-sigma factor RsiW
VEHLSQKQVENYSIRQLSAAELLAVSDHLGECEVCRGRVERSLSGDVAFLGLHEEAFSENGFESAHLAAGQTADYVDQKLAGEALQMVDDHLSGCEQCAVAVADLRAFRNEIAPSLDRRYGPASASGGWRQKFASLFKEGPVPAFGAAALAVLVVATIAWLVWRTREEKAPQVVAVSSPTPQVSQPTPSPEPSLQPSPAPEVVAQLNDGEVPPAYQNLVKKALTSQRIERSSQLQGLTRRGSSLMGSNNQPREFSVLEPVGSVLLTDRPAFRWSAMEGATGYVVEVYDDQFKLAASSPQLTDRSWTQSLPRGKIYSWQVKAIKDGQEITSPRPPAPQAKFRILDAAKANELARAKRAYSSSHLTLGLLYADAGLLKEAEQEFRLLLRSNPNSPLARTLLRQVQSLK